jgi:hypothetical protein
VLAATGLAWAVASAAPDVAATGGAEPAAAPAKADAGAASPAKAAAPAGTVAPKAGPPPLTLDSTEAALLLGGSGDLLPAPGAASANLAENARCHVCHVNYVAEELTAVHAKAKVSCARCHGASDAHCGDEGNVTAPGVMYPRERIDAACLVCHPFAPTADGALHCLKIVPPETTDKACTECHGQHRMAVRNTHWDRATGRLLGGPKAAAGKAAEPAPAVQKEKGDGKRS